MENHSIDENLKKIQDRGGILNIILEYIGLYGFSLSDNAKVLMKYGWYIPGVLELKNVDELVKIFENGNINKGNKFFVDFFEKNIKSIKQNILLKNIEYP